MHLQLTNTTLQYGSVCSGIEAVSLAWQPQGMQAAWFSEIEPFPCAVLAHHYPDVPNLGDMTHIAAQVRAGLAVAPDILVGGTPCQSFSIAGARRGLFDPRGALTLKYVELANAIDQTRQKNHRPPATIIWENVPGVLSDRSNAFGCLLGALAGESRPLEPPGPKWTHAGYVSGPQRRLAWRVLDAQYFGLAQRRKRVFLVASGRDDVDPAEVLFERDGLYGNSSQDFTPWQNAAATASPRTKASGGYGWLSQNDSDRTLSFAFGNGAGPVDVSACLLAAGTKHDANTETYVVESVAGNIAHTLDIANGGKGSSEDGTGKGASIISFAQNSRDELRWESGHGQVVGTLSTGGGKPGQGVPMVLSVSLRGRAEGTAAELGTDISPTLRASVGGGDKRLVLLHNYEAHFQYLPHEPDGTHWSQWRVRRMMPVECERLQGMPDDYTLVPYRGKPAADTPRYKAIGNSMAVPCVAWLGHRLLQHLKKEEASGAD